MMKKLTLLTVFSVFLQSVFAQCDPVTGLGVNGKPCGGTLQTAIPSLILKPDARSGGMGDVGIALTPDANSIVYNAANLAFADKKWGAALNYSPNNFAGSKGIALWLGAGYWQFGDKNKQTVAISSRYFSYGNIKWTDFNGTPFTDRKVYEMEWAAAYSRRLSPTWSVGLTGKYIYSNELSGLTSPNGNKIGAAKAGAIDISATYRKNIAIGSTKNQLTFAPVISNLGNKVSYLLGKDFLPANLGLGASWHTHYDKNHSVLVVFEANKLLVPTPNRDTLAAWRNLSSIAGALQSFSDAPGGAREEWQEIAFSTGLEYRFRDWLAVRSGYFYESPNKSGRRYWTLGAGAAYKTIALNVSYRSKLNKSEDSRYRLTLLYNFQDANRE